MNTTVRANGISVHVARLEPAETGPLLGAPTVVMLHGMGQDTMASWYFTLAWPLSMAGARVVMYDLRGHGLTERPASGYRLDDFVDDLGAVLDAADVTGPVYLLGNSFGGTIAFTFTIRYPERVAAVVSVESAPPTDAWMRRVSQRLENAARRLPAGPEFAGIGARQGDRATRRASAVRDILSGTTLVRDIPASRLPTDAQISGIRCPVLCLYGADSPVAQFAPGVRQRLPQAQTVLVPGGRHSILIDQPAEVHRLVAAWLSAHHPVASAAQP